MPSSCCRRPILIPGDLSAEYRLPEAWHQAGAEPAPIKAPSAPSPDAAKFPCQVPLGNVACCGGAEWKLSSR